MASPECLLKEPFYTWRDRERVLALGCLDGWMKGWMEEWIDGWMLDGRKQGRMNGWIDGRMEGWIDGWMDENNVDWGIVLVGKGLARRHGEFHLL